MEVPKLFRSFAAAFPLVTLPSIPLPETYRRTVVTTTTTTTATTTTKEEGTGGGPGVTTLYMLPRHAASLATYLALVMRDGADAVVAVPASADASGSMPFCADAEGNVVSGARARRPLAVDPARDPTGRERALLALLDDAVAPVTVAAVAGPNARGRGLWTSARTADAATRLDDAQLARFAEAVDALAALLQHGATTADEPRWLLGGDAPTVADAVLAAHVSFLLLCPSGEEEKGQNDRPGRILSRQGGQQLSRHRDALTALHPVPAVFFSHS